MKPFNLEAVLKGDPVVTRSGRKVVFIVYDPTTVVLDARIIVLVEGQRELRFYYENGQVFADFESPHDLFMAPKKRTVWLNLYSVSEMRRGHAAWHPTEDEADRYASKKRLGGRAFPLEIEE